MAKKTPVKKSRRRLKRSVRRSLSAVLMITAIGVAAIPVPENRASSPGIMTIAADLHDLDGLDFDNKETPESSGKYTYDDENLQETSKFKLNTYAGKTADELIEALQNGDVYASYSITNLGADTGGGELYNISWQFMYYSQTNPRDGHTAGVICKYNNGFYSPTVELPLYPFTQYFAVEEQDIDDYFTNGSTLKNKSPSATAENLKMSGDPRGAVQYTYDEYKSNMPADPFLTEYFNDDLQNYIRSVFANYKALEDSGETGDAAKPEAFSKTPSNDLTGDARKKYYAEHCDNLTTAGTGYQLVSVQDSRPGETGTVYLARGGTQAATTPYYEGDFGFLAINRSDYYMCAIGSSAFKGVNNVENMEIPEQIGYIGDEAFAEASMLKSVKLKNVSVIGNRAFKNCVNLTTAELGSATETVGAECFSGATKLQTITFDASTKTVGYGAFYNCKSLTDVTFADNGQPCEVRDFAFYNCPALRNVTMQNANITKLGKGAFAADAGAGAISFVLPRSMSASDSVGDYLFAGRASLESVIFPQDYGNAGGETTIGDNVFHGCVNLQYVEFPCNEQNAPYACGNVKYDSEKLFADVLNPDFYVKGPKLNQRGEPASPRTSTWNAKTAVSDKVPYLYVEGGVEYYEVSDDYYLQCIDDKGMLTSCTFKSDQEADWNRWANSVSSGGKGGKLVIPSKVGNTKVVGIASGCFSDPELNKRVKELEISDDSITSIGDGVFQGKKAEAAGETGEWQALEKVYIGNSVASIGSSAFKDCTSLVDVTFATPTAGYSTFTIGTDAFKTESPQLTFHGDIVEGYAPFDWATSPDNVINAQDGLRVCYQSLAPTLLTVMYNPVTDMVTLLDYPKYSEIDTILNAEYAEEIEAAGAANYNKWREQGLYTQYSDSVYDANRYAFAEKWKAADDKETLYADDTYGPWITPGFCTFVEGTHFDEWFENFGTAEPKNWQDPDESWTAAANGIADFFFEPIVSYAADKPTAYYDKYPFVVTQAVDSDNPFFPTTLEEDNLVYYTKNIVVPAGVDSIDVYGYAHNLTADGEKSVSAANNTTNLTTYLKNFNNDTGWTTASQEMYDGHLKHDEDDDIDIVSGLFSGYYVDGDAASSENRERGNDVICTLDLQSVKYLPDYAFDSCESLWSVNLGPDCSDIGVAPFRGCYSMRTVGGNDYYTTVNGIIYSVNTDGSYTIEECLSGRGNLNVVGQPTVNILSDPYLDNVSAIKPGAFEDCDSITSVDFGKQTTAGLTVIPEDCFKNCDNLQTVVLPLSANNVLPGAFTGANRLSGLTVYGKEVEISDRAFDGDPDKVWTVVRAYEDSAVERYVGKNGEQYKLQLDSQPLGELWQVSFYDPNYVLIEDLKDQSGNPLDNPQYVEDGARATEPAAPVMEGWTFERWVGSNNVDLGKPIHEDSFFYAQGFSESGMVNGKYPVEFYDGVDGKQVGPTQYIDPGKDAIAPGHPVHTGYEADGYSDTYTNIQMAKTIVLKYKAVSTSGSSTGGTQTPGNTSNRTSSSNNTTSNTSNTSTTSSSTGSTSASTIGMHVVTVNGGSGSGTYATGATVLITANTPAAGSVFSKWTTTSQGVSLANVSATPTTFSMPANDVVITAEFTAAAAPAANTGGNSGNTNSNDNGSTRVDITKPGISNKGLASANVNGSTDNFVIKITETDEATNAVREALTNKYGSLDNILYYAMDISLYDSTGTVKLTDTSGITVDITIPIPDALVTYGGNNMAGAVINGNQLENLNENFTTINGVPCIRFTATHFSPYTVYVDTGNLTEGMLDTTPKTGDPIHPKWFLSIGLACLSVILFMKKDKGAKVKTA